MRLGVYTDYSYRRAGDGIFAERAFVLFLSELTQHFERVVIAGRLNPESNSSQRLHYRLDDSVEFRALPHYGTLDRPAGVLRAMPATLRTFRGMLDDVDAVWLIGPHPFSLLFAAQAALRRKRIVLGIRSSFAEYVRMRHPTRRAIQLAGWALAVSYRMLALRVPTIVVGPRVAREYRRSRALLEISVSLVRQEDLADPTAALGRDYSGELRVLSVGRMETEKNPLLVADVLARLIAEDRRWRLQMCGEGDLEAAFRDRVEALGIAARVQMVGYTPLRGGLLDMYRDAHVLLHVSWTEGVPQVLLEAFGKGLPVVATAVGGVPGAVGDDAVLIPPGDLESAVAALRRVTSDEGLRARLVRGGLRRASERTLDREVARVAAFLREA